MAQRIPLLVLSILLALASASGQQPSEQHPPEQQAATAAATTMPLSFAEAVRKCVGFLTVRYLKDGQNEQISGTFFFVYYEDKRLGENRGFIYLVTNRHMVVPGVEKNW